LTLRSDLRFRSLSSPGVRGCLGLVSASPPENARERVVALVARVLEYRTLDLDHWRGHRPRPRERHWRVDRELVIEVVGVEAFEAFGHFHVAAKAPCRAALEHLVIEVRRLDDEGIAVPAAPRVAEPLADAVAQVRPSVERDDARVVNHLDEDGYVLFRLHNLVVVVVEAGKHRAGHPARNAPIVRAAIQPRVCRVRPAPGDLAIPPTLRRWRERRNPAVRRIDHERGAVAHRAPFVPELVVGNHAPGGPRLVLIEPFGNLPRQGLTFVLAQHGLVGLVLGSFHGRRRRIAPCSLDVRIAPGGARKSRSLPGRSRRARLSLAGHVGREERRHSDAGREPCVQRYRSRCHVQRPFNKRPLH
jgi:hypothetical protein